MAELEKLRRLSCALKDKVVKMHFSVCSSAIYTVMLHLLDQLIENISKFGSISALDSSPYEQFNTGIKVANRHTFKRLPTHINETVFGMDPMKNNAP